MKTTPVPGDDAQFLWQVVLLGALRKRGNVVLLKKETTCLSMHLGSPVDANIKITVINHSLIGIHTMGGCRPGTRVDLMGQPFSFYADFSELSDIPHVVKRNRFLKCHEEVMEIRSDLARGASYENYYLI